MTNQNQSNKVLATLSIIDALDFNEDDLSDLTGYLAKQCGFDFTIPAQKEKQLNAYDLKVIGDYVNTLQLNSLTGQEILEKGMKELQSIEAVQLSLPPVDAYNIVATVQAAIVCLDLPENSLATAKKFVYGFCDRYRDSMPTIVQCINSGWDESTHVAADEFEESLGEKWERIARDVEREMNGEVKIIVDTVDKHNDFFELVKGIYEDIDGGEDYLTVITRKEVDDDLEDRCASGHTN